MGIIEIGLHLEEIWDGEEDFGRVVTFAVWQHTGKEPCQIKIRNTTANLADKMCAILIKPKEISHLGSHHQIGRGLVKVNLRSYHSV